ncbi:hypothetical protein [Spirosoma aerolatum]|uniref:hypothetical protein n=1 Tax=Spirosoma aerolatum TaxID=1211326 RepID=UPI0009AE6603|nr:hypothetical protein [Spirosoma aerolatum]
MALNQHASNLIDITVKAFNGDSASVSPTDGMSLIDSWLDFLQTDHQHDTSLEDSLTSLRAELQNSQHDGAHIQELLSELTQQVSQLASSADTDNKPKLTSLSNALTGFQQLMDGKSGHDHTDSQAPMTSTVGGESTSMGIGASTISDDDNDLSDRTGGTVDSESAAPATSSSKGSKERSADETGDTSYSDSNRSSANKLSRSDTSRIDGMGVSGGTTDSDTTQSGGRSQY